MFLYLYDMKTDAQTCQQFEASVSCLLAAALWMTDTVCFRSYNSVQGTFKLPKTCFIEGIVDILSIPPIVYDSSLDQHLHIVRQRRLRDMKHFQNLTGAQLSTRKHIHNPKTFRIGNRFEHLRRTHVNLFLSSHLTHRNFSIFQYNLFYKRRQGHQRKQHLLQLHQCIQGRTMQRNWRN